MNLIPMCVYVCVENGEILLRYIEAFLYVGVDVDVAGITAL
jgi:hypothetical protein